MTLKELYIRCKNAFLYKVGMRFPYSKIRIKSIRKMGYQIGKCISPFRLDNCAQLCIQQRKLVYWRSCFHRTWSNHHTFLSLKFLLYLKERIS